jgi:hypothetical protein
MEAKKRKEGANSSSEGVAGYPSLLKLFEVGRMGFEELVHRIESRILELVRSLFERPLPAQKPAEPEPPRQELNRRRSEREQLEAKLATLRQRLADHQQAAAMLPSQVESSLRRGKESQAFLQALELDRIRKEMADDEETLACVEQVLWSVNFRIRHLEGQLARPAAQNEEAVRQQPEDARKRAEQRR